MSVSVCLPVDICMLTTWSYVCVSLSEPGMRIGADYQAVIPDLEEGTYVHTCVNTFSPTIYVCTYMYYVFVKICMYIRTSWILCNKCVCTLHMWEAYVNGPCWDHAVLLTASTHMHTYIGAFLSHLAHDAIVLLCGTYVQCYIRMHSSHQLHSLTCTLSAIYA